MSYLATSTSTATEAPSVPQRARRDGPATCSHEALFTRFHRTGEEAALRELVERFTPLARNLARRYKNTSEPYEDLCQIAQLGLINAIRRFDPGRGFAFHAYAIPTILGELRRYFRNSGWAIHVPRSVQERALAVRAPSAP